jgi:extracellular factor (EF) 3-hydroxypalmitic acid methyl ester biosynthesis protein
LSSAFIRRLQEWPRGYQGDYETIEKLYFAVPESPDEFGRLLDHAAFNLPICQQHRNKIAQQCEEIRRVCHDKDAPRILVVASGGAIDAWQARADLERASATVVFNDIEDDALRLIRERFGASRVCQHYVAGNMFRKRRELTRLGKFDLILCGGLFDYVDMRHIQSFVRALFDDALTDQGCMFFTNLADHNPYRYFIETVCAWEMQYRSEEDMVRAVHDAIPDADVHHWRDQTKLAVFYRLAKRAIS